MSLEEFVNFARSKPIKELAELPPDLLPDDIPADIIRRTAQPLRGVLEKMAFEIGVRELREQQVFEQKFGTPAARAVDMAQDNEAEIAHIRLRQKIQDLAPKLDAWRQRKMTNYAMGQAIAPLREAVVHIHSLRARLARAMLVLADCLKKPAQFANKLQLSYENLSKQAREIDAALGEFHTLHLEISAAEMHEKHLQIDASDGNKKELFDQIQILEEIIRRPPSFTNKLMPWANRKGMEENKDRLSELHRRILSEDWVMSETQLMRWLDVLVDANLYAPDQAQQLEHAREDMYFLLTAFCEQQEAAAHNVARNPFVQADPQQAIQFMLMSERMLLDYFARKRAEISEWLGSAAADRLQSLDGLEKELIIEMKQNLHPPTPTHSA
ncbi:MAG: hypothetical protein PHF20_03685 [Halothiobacillaceae bacterium]|nr:hypothetical protein [Halothiobacillaceae bacterium]